MMSLDKVFSRGHVKVDDVRIVRNRLTRAASDHLPLVVDFDLSGERPG
jgi:endonuclease/exonuclease/phosphatase family metal-dependent hydrolase